MEHPARPRNTNENPATGPRPSGVPASGFVAAVGTRLQRIDAWADAAGIGSKRLVLRVVSVLLTLAGIWMLTSGDLSPAETLDEYLHPETTAADDFILRDFAVDYTLDTDAEGYSRVRVVETVDALFGADSEATGITRYLQAEEGTHTVNTRVTSVTDAAGTPIDYALDRSKDHWRIVTDAGERLRGDKRFLISYEQTRLTNRVQSDDNQTFEDTLWWSVTGERWLQPMGEVEVTLRMSDALHEAVLGEPQWGVAWAIMGETGSFDAVPADDPLAEPGRAVYHGTVDDTLPAFGTVWVDFRFADGTFTAPERSLLSWGRLLAPFFPILAGVGLLLFGLAARATIWRNAGGRGFVVAENQPQKSVDVLLASHILGRGRRGIVAALLQLAVRKNVRLLRVQASEGGRSWYEFEYASSAGLTQAEQGLLDTIFGTGSRGATRTGPQRMLAPVRIRARGGLLRPAFQRLSLSAWGRQLDEGFRRVPSGFVRDLLTWGVIATTALQWGFARQLAYEGVEPQAWLLFWVSAASALVTFTAFTLAVTRYPLTEKGALAREHLLGMREYIRVAEQRRINFLQSPGGALHKRRGARVEVADLGDPLLPYAVLFGQERGWRRELDLAAAGTLPRGLWMPRDLSRTP